MVTYPCCAGLVGLTEGKKSFSSQSLTDRTPPHQNLPTPKGNKMLSARFGPVVSQFHGIGGRGFWVWKKIVSLSRRKKKEIGRYMRSAVAWDLFLVFRLSSETIVRALSSGTGVLLCGKLVLVEVHSTRITQFVNVGRRHLLGLVGRAQHVSSRQADESRRQLSNPREQFESLFYIQDNLDRREIWDTLQMSSSKLFFVGGHDLTMPLQTDKRFPRNLEQPSQILIQQVRAGSKTVFAENIDSRDSIFRPLPGGVRPRAASGTLRLGKAGSFKGLPDGGKLAFASHRVREGNQWQMRRDVSRFVVDDWHSFVDLVSGDLPARLWRKTAQNYIFGLCVEGGGVSPSPKFFDLLLRQTIPVISESAVSEVHEKLPCVVIPAWAPEFLTRDLLEDNYARLATTWVQWEKVFACMSQNYWLNYMEKQV